MDEEEQLAFALIAKQELTQNPHWDHLVLKAGVAISNCFKLIDKYGLQEVVKLKIGTPDHGHVFIVLREGGFEDEDRD